MGKLIDLTGQKFGRLTVIQQDTTKKRTSWMCKCECGRAAVVTTDKLRSGHTQSCGCLQKERTSAARKTHGATNTQLHKTWKGIKARCNNPNHKNYQQYGGRGIKMCPEWEADFGAFAAWCYSQGYHAGLTVDRKDNSKGYNPENCRLLTMHGQTRNKHDNVIVDGKVLADFIADICKETGLKPGGVYYRYYKLKENGKQPTKEAIMNYNKEAE